MSSERLAAGIGILAVLLGATAVFAEIQGALNRIWDVRPRQDRSLFRRLLRKRLYSLGLVMGVGFLLLVWVYYSALISFFGAEFTQVYTRRYGSKITPKRYAAWAGKKQKQPVGRKDQERRRNGSF